MAFGNVIYATNLTGDTEYNHTIAGDNIGMRAEFVYTQLRICIMIELCVPYFLN